MKSVARYHSRLSLAWLLPVLFFACFSPGAAHADQPQNLSGTFTVTSGSGGQFSPVDVSFNSEFGNTPQVSIGCTAGACGLGDPMAVSNVTTLGFRVTVTAQGFPANGSPVSLTIYWTATGVVLEQGSATANYMVLTVVYAPPGTAGGHSSSSVNYTSSSIAGTTTSSDQTFKDEGSVSVDNSGVGLGGGEGFDVTHSTTDSQSIEIKKSATNSLSQAGPSEDGINHDHDEILLLLKPTINVAVSSSTTRWSLAAADANAPLQYVYVGWLNGHVAMPSNILTALQSAGITPQDYKVIMAHDPFATGSSMDPNRFLPEGHTYPYEPPLTPNDPVLQSSLNLSTSQITTSGVSVEDSYGVQMSVSGGVNFLDLFNAKITAKGTWTWTNKSTNMSSTETSTAATATVGGPGYGYPGGTLITVYYDTIYNTFAFVQTTINSNSVALAGSLVDTHGAPVSNQQITLAAGSRKRTTFTDGKGRFTFLGPINGTVTVSAPGITQVIPNLQSTRQIVLHP